MSAQEQIDRIIGKARQLQMDWIEGRRNESDT